MIFANLIAGTLFYISRGSFSNTTSVAAIRFYCM